jgi:threonine/homoserine efflux transporter RhtA
VRSEDRSVLGSAVGAFVIVLAIEALTRRRLATYVIRLGVLVALFFLGGLVVAGLIASWRLTVVVLLLTLAGVFLFLNLRELRRT